MPFTDSQGNQYSMLNCTICPIGEHLYGNKWQLSGSGFYINPDGIALTASHNFRSRGENIHKSLNKEQFQRIHTPAFFRQIPLSENEVSIVITQIQEVVFLEGIDVAIVLSGIENNKPNKLTLTSKVPAIGEKIYCYSYANEEGKLDNIKSQIALNVSEFEGVISQQYLKGRDKSFLPGPCLEAVMAASGGTSGGPVFNESGQVFGVISSSLLGDPPITYITPIFPILELKFKVNTNLGPQNFTLRRLAKMGAISLIE